MRLGSVGRNQVALLVFGTISCAAGTRIGGFPILSSGTSGWLSALTEPHARFCAGALANGAPWAQASCLPQYADCLDELGRLQLENMNLKRALAACSDACSGQGCSDEDQAGIEKGRRPGAACSSGRACIPVCCRSGWMAE